MKKNTLRHFAATLLLVGATGSAQARDPFILSIDVDAGTQTGTLGFSSIDDAIDRLDVNQLANDFDQYNDASELMVDADLRGLRAGLFFAADDPALEFSVPGIQIDPNDVDQDGNTDTVLFGGNTREESLNMLSDYLKKNKDALKALLSSFAKFSPIDPLAGNPDSLFGRQMRANFDNGFTHKVSQIWGCGSSASNTFGTPIAVATAGDSSDIFRDAQERQADLMAQNEFGIGLYGSSTKAEATGGDYVSNNVTIPISYTAKLDSDPRKKIRFDLPLSASDTEGAKTYGLGLGLSYTHPLTDDWTLTPALGAGVTGSADLGSAGGARNYALTSAYTWHLDNFAVSMGNSVGRYEALSLKIGDIEAEADIKNTVYTNGLMLTGPNSLIARNMVMEYTVTDTRITGDEVYTDGYDEVGVAVGFFDTEMGVIDSYTKVGLGYLFGDGAQGSIDSLRLNLSSRF